MHIKRLHQKNIAQDLAQSDKVLVIYGARQVGKTTLVRELIRHYSGKVLEINADNMPFLEALSSRNLESRLDKELRIFPNI